eukprot:3216553-Karenia_brevis.AAC.1
MESAIARLVKPLFQARWYFLCPACLWRLPWDGLAMLRTTYWGPPPFGWMCHFLQWALVTAFRIGWECR